MKNILVYQPNNYVRFYDFQAESTKCLESIKDKANLIILQTNKQHDRQATALSLQLPVHTLFPEKNYADTYELLYNKVHNFLKAHSIDKVAVFNAYVHQYYREELRFYKKFAEFKKARTSTLKELTMHSPLCYEEFILFMLIEDFKVPVANFIEDPLQIKLKYYVDKHNTLVENYYFHDFLAEDLSPNILIDRKDHTKRYAFNFSPSQEYSYADRFDFSLTKLHDSVRAMQKTKKFVFGMTRGWSPKSVKVRDKIIDSLIMLPKNDAYYFNFECDPKYKRAGAEKFVPYSEYLEMLTQSKTTLVIQSLDPRFFSLRRFFEAICMGVLPLVHKQSNYRAGFSYDEDFIAFAEKYLVVDATDISKVHSKIDDVCDNYDVIYTQLLQTQFMQRYFSKDWHMSHMSKALLE
jgi:hypothetical protein